MADLSIIELIVSYVLMFIFLTTIPTIVLFIVKISTDNVLTWNKFDYLQILSPIIGVLVFILITRISQTSPFVTEKFFLILVAVSMAPLVTITLRAKIIPNKLTEKQLSIRLFIVSCILSSLVMIILCNRQFLPDFLINYLVS